MTPRGGASKEANVLSKDGQSVNINSSEDAEPGNVCDERWRRAQTLRGEKIGPSCEQFTKRWEGWFLPMCADDVCKMVTAELGDLQQKHLHNVSIQRSRDAASLLCHRECMWGAESGPQTLSRSASLPCLRCPVRERVTVWGQFYEKKEKKQHKSGPSHMHMIITICTSNVFCVGPSSRISFSSLCKCFPFCCEWKTKVWEPMMTMMFNLSRCCKWFSFRTTWSAV